MLITLFFLLSKTSSSPHKILTETEALLIEMVKDMKYSAVICIVLISLYIIRQSEEIGNMTDTMEVNFLRGVHRLFRDANFTDFYFSCSALGTFIQWTLNGRPLSGFTTTETGRVRRSVGPNYNYTSSLLSSRMYNDSVVMVLDSMIVVSFQRDYPEFEITCRGSHGIKKILPGEVIDSDSDRNGTLVFQHLFSSAITMNQTLIHGFICGASSILQLSGDVGPTIAFTTRESIGYSRTALKSDVSSILVQGVLLAREPLETISLFLIALDGTVTAKCFYGSDEIVLSSNLPISTPMLPPVSISHSTTPQLSTLFKIATTDHTTISSVYTTEGRANPNSKAFAVAVVVPVIIAAMIISASVVTVICIIVMKCKSKKVTIVKYDATKFEDNAIIVLSPPSIKDLLPWSNVKEDPLRHREQWFRKPNSGNKELLKRPKIYSSYANESICDERESEHRYFQVQGGGGIAAAQIAAFDTSKPIFIREDNETIITACDKKECDFFELSMRGMNKLKQRRNHPQREVFPASIRGSSADFPKC